MGNVEIILEQNPGKELKITKIWEDLHSTDSINTV